MQIILDANQISDLFFNHEKPNLDAAYASEAEPEEVESALRLDAQSFADMSGVPVDWLVNDYNKRV